MVAEFCQPVIPLALFHDNPKRERCRCHWSHMMPGEGSRSSAERHITNVQLAVDSEMNRDMLPGPPAPPFPCPGQ